MLRANNNKRENKKQNNNTTKRKTKNLEEKTKLSGRKYMSLFYELLFYNTKNIFASYINQQHPST